MLNLSNHKTTHRKCNIFPYAIAERLQSNKRSVVTLYNGHIVDLGILEKHGVIITESNNNVLNKNTLNSFASLGKEFEAYIQSQIRELFESNTFESLSNRVKSLAILKQNEIKLACPFNIPDFADFFACRNHAENASKIILGDKARLNLNWESMPIGYYGKSRSIICEDHHITIPYGNILNPITKKPEYLKSRMVDFEVELGFFIGKSSNQESISIHNANEYIFGVVLLNDWSARDIQFFESHPLGPFLSKSFATTISPWVFSYQALKPFMSPIENPPFAMKHLIKQDNSIPNIELSVILKTPKSPEPFLLSKVNSTNLSWSFEQITTHIVSNGNTLNTGDLIGSGTISGSMRSELGCLLEITKNGQEPIQLSNIEQRSYLKKGDTIEISALSQNKDSFVELGSIFSSIK